jgi:DNA polymerase sigma
MKELTSEQIERQDSVDNAIYQLIQSVNPTDKEIEWDIEMIGDIRNVIAEWMIERLKITDEQNFYPYLED